MQRLGEMIGWAIILVVFVMLALFFLPADLVAQAQEGQPQRVKQITIVIEARRVQGIWSYDDEGRLEIVRCKKPSRWISEDRRDNGWACFDGSISTWILNAIPPTTTPAIQRNPAPPEQQKPGFNIPDPAVRRQNPGTSQGSSTVDAIRVGASKVDEAKQRVELYKRNGLHGLIPCRTDLETIIPGVIMGSCRIFPSIGIR